MPAIERVLRGLVLACAAAGVAVTFAWPFLVSPDPASAPLMYLSRGIVAVLLLALVAAAVAKARRLRRGEP